MAIACRIIDRQSRCASGLVQVATSRVQQYAKVLVAQGRAAAAACSSRAKGDWQPLAAGVPDTIRFKHSHKASRMIDL